MGQLIRILILLAGLWLILHFVRRALRRHRRPENETRPGAARMVACALCGTHIPESEAVRAGNQVYCCEEHRRSAEST